MKSTIGKVVEFDLPLLEQKTDWIDDVLSLDRMDFLNQAEEDELNRLVPVGTVATEKNVAYVLINTATNPSEVIREAAKSGMKTTNLVEALNIVSGENNQIIREKTCGFAVFGGHVPLIVATSEMKGILYGAMVSEGPRENGTLVERVNKDKALEESYAVWLLFRK